MTALPRLPRPAHTPKRISLIGPKLKLNDIESSEDQLEIVSKGVTHSHGKDSIEELDNPHNDHGDDISWDGDMDPNNPLNWPDSKKWATVSLVAILTLISALASSMFAPGVPQVLRDFSSSSSTLATFVVSIFLLGNAVGPLVIAPPLRAARPPPHLPRQQRRLPRIHHRLRHGPLDARPRLIFVAVKFQERMVLILRLNIDTSAR